MTNENEIEKKIISSGAIDYLADKLKQHNHLKGIKLERTQPNGTRESLSIWKEGNKKEWEKINISTNQPKQWTIDNNQGIFKEENIKNTERTTTKAMPINNTNEEN